MRQLSKDLVRWVDVDFEAVEPGRWRESNLVKTLLWAIRSEAVSLQQTEARVRGNLVVDTNHLVHRTMVALTGILLLIALVTLALRLC